MSSGPLASTYKDSIKLYDHMSHLQGELKRNEDHQFQLEQEFQRLWNSNSSSVVITNLGREPKVSGIEKSQLLLSSSSSTNPLNYLNSSSEEEEASRRARNHEILEKIQELETTASVFAARSERLKMMKNEYENLVRKYAISRRDTTNQIHTSSSSVGINTDITGPIQPHPEPDKVPQNNKKSRTNIEEVEEGPKLGHLKPEGREGHPSSSSLISQQQLYKTSFIHPHPQEPSPKGGIVLDPFSRKVTFPDVSTTSSSSSSVEKVAVNSTSINQPEEGNVGNSSGNKLLGESSEESGTATSLSLLLPNSHGIRRRRDEEDEEANQIPEQQQQEEEHLNKSRSNIFSESESTTGGERHVDNLIKSQSNEEEEESSSQDHHKIPPPEDDSLGDASSLQRSGSKDNDLLGGLMDENENKSTNEKERGSSGITKQRKNVTFPDESSISVPSSRPLVVQHDEENKVSQDALADEPTRTSSDQSQAVSESEDIMKGTEPFEPSKSGKGSEETSSRDKNKELEDDVSTASGSDPKSSSKKKGESPRKGFGLFGWNKPKFTGPEKKDKKQKPSAAKKGGLGRLKLNYDDSESEHSERSEKSSNKKKDSKIKDPSNPDPSKKKIPEEKQTKDDLDAEFGDFFG